MSWTRLGSYTTCLHSSCPRCCSSRGGASWPAQALPGWTQRASAACAASCCRLHAWTAPHCRPARAIDLVVGDVADAATPLLARTALTLLRLAAAAAAARVSADQLAALTALRSLQQLEVELAGSAWRLADLAGSLGKLPLSSQDCCGKWRQARLYRTCTAGEPA